MKWYGKIGFATTKETEPDVFVTEIEEHEYFGDILKASKSTRFDNTVNPSISISNQLSVISDPFIQRNFHKIVYVTFGGAKWTISSINVEPPRLIMTFGELYNEDEEVSNEE